MNNQHARGLPRRPIPTGARNNGRDGQLNPGASNSHGQPGNPCTSDYYDEGSYFMGFGSICDLRDSDRPAPRLAGLKSVKQAYAMARPEPAPQRQPMGFDRPKP